LSNAGDSAEIYKKLLEIYENRYRNPKPVLEHDIAEFMKDGVSKENAILKLFKQMEKTEQIETKNPLEKRVLELEKELHQMKTKQRIVELEQNIEKEKLKEQLYSTKDEITNSEMSAKEGLDVVVAILLFLFPIAALVGAIMYRQEGKSQKAEEAFYLLIIGFIMWAFILVFLVRML
jgi:hypothetical protein